MGHTDRSFAANHAPPGKLVAALPVSPAAPGLIGGLAAVGEAH